MPIQPFSEMKSLAGMVLVTKWWPRCKLNDPVMQVSQISQISQILISTFFRSETGCLASGLVTERNTHLEFQSEMKPGRSMLAGCTFAKRKLKLCVTGCQCGCLSFAVSFAIGCRSLTLATFSLHLHPPFLIFKERLRRNSKKTKIKRTHTHT